MRRFATTRSCSLLAIASLLAMTASAAAQETEPLVWKFTPGATNRYRMTQDVDMTMDLGAAGQKSSKLHQVIDNSWTIDKVNDDGSAVLTQKIDRMRMKITAEGQEAEIDSAAKEEPQGHAATLVPLVKAITEGVFTVTMTPRGEVKDVKVPESLMKALQASPSAALLGDMVTAEGFKKLVAQAAFALPEKLEPGGQWSTNVETKLPAIGTQTAKTTYRYEGPKEIEGVQLEAFTPTLEMKFAGGEAKVDVTGQESSGEVLFNREAGRLESSKIKHGLDLTLTVGGQEITQKLDRTIEMKWVPEEEDEEIE